MFQSNYPAAWTFHYNTCRSELNTLSPQAANHQPGPYKEYLLAPVTVLPEACLPDSSFSGLLKQRFSCRQFKNWPLTLQHVSNILFAAYGITNTILLGNEEFLERPVPSGGGLYPLEFYLFVRNVTGLAPGIYHYVQLPGLLEQIKQTELPKPFLQNLFMQQPYVADASFIVVTTAVIERTMKKYGDRGYRYILFEAGHAFQNINLAATACQLGSVNIGGFFDLDMTHIMGIDIEEEIPLYAVAVGMPDMPDKTNRIPAL